MSELHSCPYCRRAYKYRELLFMKGKRHECKNCRRIMKINRTLCFLTIAILIIILAFANFLIIRGTENMSIGSFLKMALTDAAIIFTVLMICPLLTGFKKADKKRYNKQ